MKNKKGFTLVELLAVIVILALIMSIAIISIGGVLDNAKTSTFKETAASMIDGVKKQLLINNKLEAGDYTFTTAVLDKGGSESPFGGEFILAGKTIGSTTYAFCTGTTEAGTEIVSGSICKLTTARSNCTDTTVSFVRIASDKTASICLTAGSGNKYINLGTEAALLGSDDDMISG